VAYFLTHSVCGIVHVGVIRDRLLAQAVADILCQAADSHVVVCDIVADTLSSLPNDTDTALASSAARSEFVTNELSSLSSAEGGSSQTAVKRRRLGHEQFHASLRSGSCKSCHMFRYCQAVFTWRFGTGIGHTGPG